MAKKILLVDDSATSRLTNRLLLGKCTNYEVISACDGKQGVELALKQRPDLILMDIEMPRMTGLEACKFLRQQESTRNTPIILLTTKSGDSVVREGYANGCSEFLSKPVNETKLMALLKGFLRE